MALTKSTFIWSAMTEKGYDFPKNHKQAIQLVKNYSASVKAELENQLISLLLIGECFSITLDEYTSLKNRRFLNINIHQKNKHWNLGLTRVSGSFPAEKAAEIVSERVEELGLNLADCIICSFTDGASMMVKFGKIVPTEHQTCYTHGVHLAIQEVSYKKNQSNNLDEEKVESDNDEEDSDSDNEENSRFIDDKINESISLPKVKVHFQSVIIKVRKIVKLFRKSPVKNDVLQEEVKKHHGREVALILDCQTRWNSLLAMIQQFLKINEQIGVVLADISPSLICTEQELDILTDIVDALEPVKLAAEALCRKNATLLTAEGIFKFLIYKLNQKKSSLCIRMKDAVLKRFTERRQSNLVSLYKYLSKPDCLYKIEGHEIFNMPSKTVLQKTAKSLLSRLFLTKDIEILDQVERGKGRKEAEEQLSLQEELEEAIEHSAKKQRHNSNDELKAISKEMMVFEATSKRTTNLELLFNALETIPPTSVE